MHPIRRVFVLFCASLISVLCGTLYIFSAYSPQIAVKLNYTSSQTSSIAIAGTVGVILSGPFSGLLIDKTGYTLPISFGSLLITLGYYLFRNQFRDAKSNLFYSCFLYFAIGWGSTAVNAAAIKCCMVLFPNRRGVATALPIAFYGASASIYSAIGSTCYPGRTSDFLGFLCYSSFIGALVCAPLICLCDREQTSGRSLRNATIIDPSGIEMIEIGTPPLSKDLIKSAASGTATPSGSSGYIYKHYDFWIIAVILGILAGLGQMYIYSVGYMVTALVGGLEFIQANASTYRVMVQQQQQYQVGLISIASCLGRLGSGFIADAFHSNSRLNLILVPSVLCIISQVLGYTIGELKNLSILSCLVGFGYGFMYCIFPIIIGDIWGLQSFSFNWGLTNLTPIVTNLIITHFFGRNYDSNIEQSVVKLPNSKGVLQDVTMKVCNNGAKCYSRAFQFTILLSVITFFIAISLLSRHKRTSDRKRRSSF